VLSTVPQRSFQLGHYSVEVRDLTKSHGATLAVDRCSFSVKRGEFFSLLGPSGSGKTSTLRLLAGFERPDAGDITIEGRSMQNVPPNHRPVNLVFQHYALFPHLTVFRNVAFGLEMRRVPPADIRDRVAAALAMVRLADKGDRAPSQLSGGEQQRVALARALVNRPAVLLLDEPLGALDQQLRRDMQLELKTIQERVGITFICVTHHQEEALTMSDRVAVMDHGRILQIGTPQEIYEAPSSVFVADFIGESNQLTGRVVPIDERVGRFEAPDLPAIVARRPASSLAGESRATLIVRPERVALCRDAGQPGFDNAVPGRIDKAVYNGSEMQYWIRLTGATVWKVHVPNATTDQKRFAPGESVLIGWNAADGVVLTE
jgi:spermidine/putrescine transport system ATP-binding protein